MSKGAPGGNKLIKRRAKKQRIVGKNLIKSGKCLDKAGKELLDMYKIKINYTKKTLI